MKEIREALRTAKELIEVAENSFDKEAVGWKRPKSQSDGTLPVDIKYVINELEAYARQRMSDEQKNKKFTADQVTAELDRMVGVVAELIDPQGEVRD